MFYFVFLAFYLQASGPKKNYVRIVSKGQVTGPTDPIHENPDLSFAKLLSGFGKPG